MFGKTARWHIAAFFFTAVTGTLLHFLYEWTGYSLTAALVSPVNGSLWEHAKLGVTPILFFALAEYLFVEIPGRRLLVAKTAAAYAFMIGMILLFYLYTAILGRHFLVIDILIFLFMAAAAQYLSYRIIKSEKDFGKYYHAALMLCILLLLAFIAFTFDPPRTDLFMDGKTLSYGLPVI